jgi:hypothetical protein
MPWACGGTSWESPTRRSAARSCWRWRPQPRHWEQLALGLQRGATGGEPIAVLEVWLLDAEGNRLLLVLA